MSISRAGNGNTTQACAACKHQRRKCAPDCILAPYFPHDRQRQFLNAHKLFGVSNITKIIKTLNPPQKDEAMRTIIFQSDIRASDPVGGCYRIIRDLQRQIEYYKAELDLVLHQLAICRAQAAAAQQQQSSIQQLHEVSQNNNNNNSTLINCDVVSNADGLEDVSFSYVQNLQEQYVIDGNDQSNNENGSHQQLQDPGTWGTQESVSSSLPIEQQHYVNGITMM